MQWTLDEFYADGGTTAFVDRLAGALGIHASNIKIVSVYQGSVIVDYQIFDAIGELSKSGDIEKVKARLVGMIVNKTLSLGAPILNADVSTKVVTNSFSSSTTGSGSGSGSTATSTQGNQEPQVVVSTTSGGVKITTSNNKISIVTGIDKANQSVE